MAPAGAKTLYVKNPDTVLWDRFERAVREFQAADSVSGLVAEAMRNYLDQFGDQGGGLYVQAPDEDPGNATFDDNRTAILQREADGWTLTYLDVSGDPDIHQLGRCTPREAVADARKFLAQFPLRHRVGALAREMSALQPTVDDLAQRALALLREIEGEVPHDEVGGEELERRYAACGWDRVHDAVTGLVAALEAGLDQPDERYRLPDWYRR